MCRFGFFQKGRIHYVFNFDWSIFVQVWLRSAYGAFHRRPLRHRYEILPDQAFHFETCETETH